MFGTQQFAGQQVRPQQYQYGTVSGYYPLQVSGPSAYYPMQTTDTWSDMFAGMMPMIMMVMMFAMIIPMFKGITAKE